MSTKTSTAPSVGPDAAADGGGTAAHGQSPPRQVDGTPVAEALADAAGGLAGLEPLRTYLETAARVLRALDEVAELPPEVLRAVARSWVAATDRVEAMLPATLTDAQRTAVGDVKQAGAAAWDALEDFEQVDDMAASAKTRRRR